VLSALLLVVHPASVLALEPINNVLLCDSDGDSVWGTDADAIGKAWIGEKGDVKLSIHGLPRDTAFTCALDCRPSPTDPQENVFSGSCSTNHSGDLIVKYSHAAAPSALPLGGCFTPQVRVAPGATLVCISGYGTVDVP
jgi:hypothetical protein